MPHRKPSYALAALVALVGVAAVRGAVDAARQAPQPPVGQDLQGRAGRGQGGQTPTRDMSAPQQAAATGTGRISGRVLIADTGSPVRGARVSLTAVQLPGGRALVTDSSGLFDFAALPEGRYTLSVSKTGFVTLAYGQRRPLQPGTPLQLADGQRLQGIEMRLPRGSAIAGHVFDENGDPLPNTVVRVMRYQYQDGQRRLTMAGSGQTDDRGQYRVWGLNPGDYYVSAVMPNVGSLLQLGGRGFGPGGRGGIGGRGGPDGTDGTGGTGGVGQDQFGVGRGARGAGAGGVGAFINGALFDPAVGDALAAAGLANLTTTFGAAPLDGSAEAVAYAPTYYPGVSSPGDARPVSVGLGAEVLDIDFALLLVRTWQVSGRVTTPDGSPAINSTVNLSSDDGGAARGGGPFGETFASRVQADGGFAIANVPPGRYILRARSNQGGPGGFGFGGRGGRGGGGGRGAGAPGAAGAETLPPQFASQPIIVNGDVTDLTISLSAGATINGAVSLPAVQSGNPPNTSQIRVMAQATDPALGTNINAQVQQDGRFTLQGVPAGAHWFRALAPRGLILKSVTIGGRDVIDDPYEVRGGETIDNVTVVFTDRVSEINGMITDDRGAPITDYTVLAFSEDSRLWRPQARQIMTARPDQNGKFQLRGLPPGRYCLAAIDPAVAGEWFEPAFLEQHRAGAIRLSLNEGDVKTQDFRMR